MEKPSSQSKPPAGVLRDGLVVIGAALALIVPCALVASGPRTAAAEAEVSAAPETAAPAGPAAVAGVAIGPLSPVARIEAARGHTPPAPIRKDGLGSVGQAFSNAVDRQLIYDMVRRHQAGESEESIHALADVIHREAVRAQMDPLIVASMVAKESSFEPAIVSHKGAMGLMQLLPVVGQEVAVRHGIEWRGDETLSDPQTNLRLGILYYKELKRRFAGDRLKALTAYCYGPGWVQKQLEADAFSGSVYATSVLTLYADLSATRDKLGGEPKRART